MLESVAIVGHIVVVVVWIGEKRVAGCEDIACADVGRWQLGLAGVANNENFTGIVTEILAEFVTQICVCVSLANDFYRISCT